MSFFPSSHSPRAVNNSYQEQKLAAVTVFCLFCEYFPLKQSWIPHERKRKKISFCLFKGLFENFLEICHLKVWLLYAHKLLEAQRPE